MNSSVSCSKCGKAIEVPEKFNNPFIKCPGCGHWEKAPVRSSKPAGVQSATPSSRTPAAVPPPPPRKPEASPQAPASAKNLGPADDSLESLIAFYHRPRPLQGYGEIIQASRIRRVPRDEETQDLLLRAFRSSLWNKQYGEYQTLLMACYMGEQEIIERKRFFLRYAAMLCRHVAIIPKIGEDTQVQYVAEDMIDGGEPELVAAGKRLNEVIASAGKEGIQAPMKMPSLPLIDSRWLERYSRQPARFIEEFVEPFSGYDSDRFYGIAVAAEVLELDREDVTRVFPLLTGGTSPYDQYFCTFAQVTANLLADAGYQDWIPVVCDLFGGLCGKHRSILEKRKSHLQHPETLSPSRDSAGIPIPPELELTEISRAWRNQGIDTAFPLGRERLQKTPDDALACGILGQMYLEKMSILGALACFTRAFHLEPQNPLIVYFLGAAYHAGYFEEQVDLCRNLLQTMPAYQANPDKFRYPVELFLKCDEPDAIAEVDGHDLGPCPVRLGHVKPGPHQITWKRSNGKQKSVTLDLQEATVSKFRFHPDRDEISDEISRCGAITLYTPDGPKELRELVTAYLVASLDQLPHPSIEDCLRT